MQILWFKNLRILLSLQIDFFSVLVEFPSQFLNIEFSVLENEDNPVTILAASKSKSKHFSNLFAKEMLQFYYASHSNEEKKKTNNLNNKG